MLKKNKKKEMLDLRDYDGKCVRIVGTDGEVFEGNCEHFSEAYSEHEFGREEDGLQMIDFLFYRNDIKSIRSLEDQEGPYGHFSGPYSSLEVMNAEDADLVDEVLLSEDDVHVLRMLNYLETHPETVDGYDKKNKDILAKSLHDVLVLSEDPACHEAARRLIDYLHRKESSDD